MTFEENTISTSVGQCPVCSQGRQVLAQKTDGKLVVYCEECETMWPTPMDALYNRNSFRDDSGEKLTVVQKINPWETQVFIAQLVEYVSQLRDLLTEHLQDNNNELLPHVFFGDLTRYAVSEVKKGATKPHEPLARILFFLEEGLKLEDKDIENLILASFVENLLDEPEAQEKIKSMAGPHLAKVL